MAAKENSQSQKEGFVASMFEKNLERFESMVDEVAKVEEKTMKQTYKGVDDAAQMWKASLEYATELNAQWREMVLETSRRTAEMMTRR